MKIKKTRLLQIIQEELSRINEAPAFRDDPEGEAAADKMMDRISNRGGMIGEKLSDEDRFKALQVLNNEGPWNEEKQEALGALAGDFSARFRNVYSKASEDNVQDALVQRHRVDARLPAALGGIASHLAPQVLGEHLVTKADAYDGKTLAHKQNVLYELVKPREPPYVRGEGVRAGPGQYYGPNSASIDFRGKSGERLFHNGTVVLNAGEAVDDLVLGEGKRCAA